jgi:hypothetical protein
MAMFAVHYCLANSVAEVPIELKFAWLDGRTPRNGRNPNKGTLTFPRLDGNDQKHARNMWRARRILNAAAEAAPCSVLQLERALFMVGYDKTRSLGIINANRSCCRADESGPILSVQVLIDENHLLGM